MSFFFDKVDYDEAPVLPEPYRGTDLSFTEAMGEAYNAATRGSNSDAYAMLLREEFIPIINLLNERKLSDEHFFKNPGDYARTMAEEYRIGAIRTIFDYIRANEDRFPELKHLDMDEIDARILANAQKNLVAGDTISARTGLVGAAGSIIGTMAGNLVDTNFLDALFGTAAFTSMRGVGLVGRMVGEAIVGAGSEAITIPAVKDWYESLGVDYTWGDAFAQIATAGVFGAALPAAGRGLGITFDKAKEGIEAYRKAGLLNDSEANVLRAAVDDTQIISAKERPDMTYQEHMSKVDEATLEIYYLDGKAERATENITPSQTRAPEMGPVSPSKMSEEIRGIKDSDEVVLDSEIDGNPRSYTGAELKREIEEADAALERLRGCVIR